MKILVLNCGSSSLKYQVHDAPACTALGGGKIARLGQADGPPDHRTALREAFAALAEDGILTDHGELLAIGHRVVHGGEHFRAPLMLDEATLAALHKLTPLAPLHNPANLLGIEVATTLCPGVPQVAVFDTAFHQSLPPHAWHYALPEWVWREHRVRRYGFHGISVQSVSRQAAGLLGRPLETLNLIVLHLGNGASATAVAQGNSIDTSMGMTPLEGLVMGTRCGDLDAAVPFYLMRQAGLDAEAAERLLFHDSGLHGLCGVGDMRDVHARAEQGDEAAQLALAVTGYRLKKYIGAYSAVLGRVNALIFTAGIGEHDADIRARACHGLDHLGIRLDPDANQADHPATRRISHFDSAVQVWVIPTDEEREIALETLDVIDKKAR